MGTKHLLRAGLAVAALALGGGAAQAQTAPAENGALGCQAIVTAVAETGRVALSGVYFDFNRAALRPDSLPALLAARDAIRLLGGEWTIEGHTDSVGSHAYNQQLSLARAQAVADWLGSAGVASAHLSAQGFSFDRPIADNATEIGRAQNRRVELVAQSPDFDAVGFGGPADVEAEGCGEAAPSGEAAASSIADWSGAGGHEWLPFSGLMATAMGGSSGWSGARIDMPLGSQPEACRALCFAEDNCGAFSYEPKGSFFIEYPRCNLIGYGSEMELNRENGYAEDGTFFASGLKPDAELLNPVSQAVAEAILADMAELDALRTRVTLEAASEAVSGQELAFRITGAVPADQYETVLQIGVLGDYTYRWPNVPAARFRPEFADDGSGLIEVPEPGTYSLRYVINHPTFGSHVIAEQVLTVLPEGAAVPVSAAPATSTASGLTVSGPAQVHAGASLWVSWSSINDGGDWVTIVPAGAEDGTWTDYRYVGSSTRETLTAPAEPGLYELRYVRDADYATLGRHVVEVVAPGTAIDAAPQPTPPSTPFETEGMGEDTGYYCPADAALCPFEDEATSIGFTLAPGFYTDFPYLYETAGGAAAQSPALSLYRIADNALVATLNQRQWSADLGPCFDNALGQLCLYAPDGLDAIPGDAQMAFAFFSASLTPLTTAAAPEPEPEPVAASEPEPLDDDDFVANFMRQSGVADMIREATADDPEAAQIAELLGNLLGAGNTPASAAPRVVTQSESPMMRQLNGQPLVVEGMSFEDLLAILAPRSGEINR